ncbi:MAG: ECF-type sigma factor [Planctomycetota bacterium]
MAMATVPRIQLDELLPQVYEDLRRCASRALAGERPGHVYQTTELVHETYMRLAQINRINWREENDILRAAVVVMRRVLIDHARARNARKRDAGKIRRLSASDIEMQVATPTRSLDDVLAVDEALEKLRKFDSRKADILELRYFGGQTIESVAVVLDISEATVKRDWTLAKTWMQRELTV